MISKKKIFNLGGPLLGDRKHGEALFTVSRHCDLYKKKFLRPQAQVTTTQEEEAGHAADLQPFFFSF